MKCHTCGNQNQPNSKFCGQCGVKLEMICPNCDLSNQPNNQFCEGCGFKLADPNPALSGSTLKPTEIPPKRVPLQKLVKGERRHATIAFSDLSGYTAFNERLDPELVQQFMSRIKSASIEVVEKHAGVVNQFIGDEIVSLFGIPKARKNDAVRAVRAMVELHERVKAISNEFLHQIGAPLTLHTGVCTGLIVTHIEDERDGRFGLTGDTVNTGARILSQAKNNEIFVCPVTNQLISSFYKTKITKSVQLKGKANPISPFHVQHEYETPLQSFRKIIGRTDEINHFKSIIESCLEHGTGKIILIRSEAGIGKTRLAHEFKDISIAKGFMPLTGLIVDFGIQKEQGALYLLLLGLLDLEHNSNPKEHENALIEAVEGGVIAPKDVIFFKSLLEVELDSHEKKIYQALDRHSLHKGKLEAFGGLLQKISMEEPLMLLIEDIHWIDETTLSYLAEFAQRVQKSKIILTMTSRFLGDPLGKGWRNACGGAPLITFDLGPLETEDLSAMAQEFPKIKAEVLFHCIQKSEGNPLFLEQLLLSVNTALGDNLPSSIQSIVLSRMDSLSETDREAIQVASVIGQRFSPELLCFLLGKESFNCESLMLQQLIKPEGNEFLFIHALVMEGVYQSLLKSKIRILHQKAAQWYKQIDPLVYAEHLQRAEDPKASEAYLQAAEVMLVEYNYNKAMETIQKGLQLQPTKAVASALKLMEGKIYYDLGRGNESIESYHFALEQCTDELKITEILIGLVESLILTEQLTEALETLQRAELLAKKNKLIFELAKLHHLRGNLFFPQGKIEECKEQHELSFKYAKQAKSPKLQANALSGLGDAAYNQVKMKTANMHFMDCVELCRKNGLARIEASNLFMVGITHVFLNNPKQGYQDCLDTIQLARKISHPRAELVAVRILMDIQIEMNHWDEVKENDILIKNLVEQLKIKRFDGEILACRGNIAWRDGNQKEANEYFNLAVLSCRESGMTFDGPVALAHLAKHTVDKKQRDLYLNEGEELLKNGCAGHSYFYFFKAAIETCLRYKDWGRVANYAAKFQDYLGDEATEYSEFIIERGLLLAAWGQGERNDTVKEKMQEHIQEAELIGHHSMLLLLQETQENRIKSNKPA